MNETQRDIVKTLAGDEARDPWFMSLSAKQNSNPVECESYIRGAFLLVSRCFENRGCLKQPVTLEEATKWAAILTHNPIDNFRSALCFLSGYHSNHYRGPDDPNTPEEDKFWREEQDPRQKSLPKVRKSILPNPPNRETFYLAIVFSSTTVYSAG